MLGFLGKVCVFKPSPPDLLGFLKTLSAISPVRRPSPIKIFTMSSLTAAARVSLSPLAPGAQAAQGTCRESYAIGDIVKVRVSASASHLSLSLLEGWRQIVWLIFRWVYLGLCPSQGECRKGKSGSQEGCPGPSPVLSAQAAICGPCQHRYY